ncbi:MAG TPA: rhomboid family intramembrane serine protease [Terriglobales bacterium]|nr:rhomboid family intramembrane serine protease [Terriglobales bacterium]
MFPLYDDAPRYSTPYINYFLLALNTLVYLFESALSPRAFSQFVGTFGVIPAHVTAALHGHGDPVSAFVPILTSMFIHASWPHVIFNMWFLYLFGDNVEDYLGHFRYLLFYLLSGLAASWLQIVLNSHDTIPNIGASGAIAGVLGAYFILFPSARVLTWIFILLIWLPAWVFLVVWFVGQFLSGAATSLASQTNHGGIAFWAHVGGFIAGLGLIKLFPTRPRRYRYFYR